MWGRRVLWLVRSFLILRGVAFEFRHKAGPRMRVVWDAGFVRGSHVATFVQGSTVGTLVSGLAVGPDGRFAGGGVLDWLSTFAALYGVGLFLGGAMLGAAWLVLKSEGDLRARGYRQLRWFLLGVLAFLACAFVASTSMHLPVLQRWTERPWPTVFPPIGRLAVALMLLGARLRRDTWPFVVAALIFCPAFAALAASFVPYMVPFSITIADAAAPHSSLAFIFWCAGIFVQPLTLIYTVVNYGVFKVRSTRMPDTIDRGLCNECNGLPQTTTRHLAASQASDLVRHRQRAPALPNVR
jgi:cytochrome bd ubiquinol oxidase subunit II